MIGSLRKKKGIFSYICR